MIVWARIPTRLRRGGKGPLLPMFQGTNSRAMERLGTPRRLGKHARGGGAKTASTQGTHPNSGWGLVGGHNGDATGTASAGKQSKAFPAEREKRSLLGMLGKDGPGVSWPRCLGAEYWSGR